MDFTANIRRPHRSVESDSLAELYPHDLNLFMDHPKSLIDLTEFEELALERVQLFRIIEEAGIKGHKLYSEDWKNCVKEALSKAGLKKFYRLLGGYNGSGDIDYQARRVDHISHFILRIAYCRSEELRRWFLNRELEWFRLKFVAQSSENIKIFLHLNQLAYKPISEEEKMKFREELTCSTVALHNFESVEFYKVPFTEVCSLVRSRKVFLHRGLAYIPASELVISIMSIFRANLSENLALYCKRLPNFDDERFLLLSNLHQAHTGNNYVVREDKQSIDAANLDLYSKKHFPLCMRQMHDTLKTAHHLKHQSRLTYGLFLKGIGLLYEDAVRFWKHEFTKKIDSNKFDKEYLYNIKHQYGKVGGMVNYTPYSCMKVIMSNVSDGECHGCPFKNWDPSVIKQKLLENGGSEENGSEIKDLVTNKHYQLACSKYFEYTHAKAASSGINHPNQYFEESLNFEKATLTNTS